MTAQPYTLLFATLSGAHLYGFPSPDSDFDLRGVHCLPFQELVGLEHGPETMTTARIVDGLDIDLVTHEARKFFELMLQRNGYVLEQLFSPIVVQGGPFFDELKDIGRTCVTKHHARHYLGFATTQKKLFEKETPRRIKPLLYVYRVLLTGIHLMKTGVVEANLEILLRSYPLPQVPELLERKRNGPEKGTLADSELDQHDKAYARLYGELETLMTTTSLPDRTEARPRMHDLLLRIRAGARS